MLLSPELSCFNSLNLGSHKIWGMLVGFFSIMNKIMPVSQKRVTQPSSILHHDGESNPFQYCELFFEGNSFCLERMLPRHLNTSSSNHLTGTCCSSFGVAVCMFETSAQVAHNLPKKMPSHIQQRAMNCAQMNQQMRHLSLIVLSVLMSVQ